MHTGGIKQVYCCRREPRDASCLSVASIVQCRAQSSVISYFRFRCTAAYKQIQFTALQRHCGNLWHKHTCTVKPGTHCMATKSNSRRSTWLKVDKVDRVALAIYTSWRQSRKDVRHSGNKVDRIGNNVETS